MALSQGSSALWSDINALYTTLRSIQSTHGLTQTANPSGSGAGTSILTTHITPINTALDAMKSESHLRTSSYVGAGTNPTRGSLITPAIITQLRTKLDNLRNVRHVDSFDSFNGFDFSFDWSFSVGNPGFFFNDNQCVPFGN